MSTFFELEEGQCYSLDGEVLGEFEKIVEKLSEDGSELETFLQFKKNGGSTLFRDFTVSSKFIKISCSLVPGYRSSSAVAASSPASSSAAASSSSSSATRFPENDFEENLQESIRRSLLDQSRYGSGLGTRAEAGAGSGSGSSSSSSAAAPAPAALPIRPPSSTAVQNLKANTRAKLEESITCPVCIELFSSTRDPITIPCGHSLCRVCLRESLRIRPQCPVCREPTPGPVESYKRSVTIGALVDLFYKPR